MSAPNTAGARPEALDSGLPLDLMLDLPVEITVELGRRKMTIGEFLDLGPGAVLELRKLVGDPLDIRVNQRLIARGEAVAVGEMYGIRITEVVQRRPSGPVATAGTAAVSVQGVETR
ncbi:MAG: flagellar motor switch protein FliN [Myxococcales bacterium]|nr:flagellar motor switch protein FliN [Myxococcota bacterium]MDW8283361.1 flagellar motor switch protein FliN [Myxococcales bacterium]